MDEEILPHGERSDPIAVVTMAGQIAMDVALDELELGPMNRMATHMSALSLALAMAIAYYLPDKVENRKFWDEFSKDCRRMAIRIASRDRSAPPAPPM